MDTKVDGGGCIGHPFVSSPCFFSLAATTAGERRHPHTHQETHLFFHTPNRQARQKSGCWAARSSPTARASLPPPNARTGAGARNERCETGTCHWKKGRNTGPKRKREQGRSWGCLLRQKARAHAKTKRGGHGGRKRRLLLQRKEEKKRRRPRAHHKVQRKKSNRDTNLHSFIYYSTSPSWSSRPPPPPASATRGCPG